MYVHVQRMFPMLPCFQLQVLDVSCNEIEDFDTQQLPPSLVMLNLAHNPCCLNHGFEQKIVSALPKLMVRWIPVPS